mmetsp:Transcript_12877/g.24181  ORF Transcript_12877/g.24181 Transcript_12877/m.24181 type:complete len:474 (+) Transcript_12877:173-1594(+)|eukprot:CAMPEP_0176498662 /NCGR_PEP_ID=MMETSP0200_2-20121128/12456_1 /TAXON_ID=947934 /ORGANISM="Chaetoceros sp., Strain GSL56" /LENGTH=473 /DNA_ID=CAMNT_0017896915 /DNA_START=68 /DNA_END=1489 /DNA_ORIENTATION=+
MTKYHSAALFVFMSLSSIAVGDSAPCFPDRTALNSAITSAINFNPTGAGYNDGTYGTIEDWCFDSGLTDFSLLFQAKNTFNADISGWNVSSVTNMQRMFREASAFNQDISGWDVSSVTDMGGMFFRITAFNQDISGWNVSSVNNMAGMFREASAFNQDLCPWGPKMFDGTPPGVTNMFVSSGCPNTSAPIDGTDGGVPQNLCSSSLCLPPTTSSGGDPHFIGFKQKLVTFQGECTLILLDSPAATAIGDDVTVHVRTTRKFDFSYISGVAMKVGDDVIEIKPDATLFLNGNLISEDSSMSGFPIALKKAATGTAKFILSYSFDLGHGRVIDIRANMKRNMMFVSTKGHFPEATQGMLGSPGHDALVSRDGKNLSEIDVNTYGESWQVKDVDPKLFMDPLGPQYPQRCLYEDAPGAATSQLRGRRRLMKKRVIELEDAKAVCSHVSSDIKRELCIQDTIAMGDLEIKDDPFYLE